MNIFETLSKLSEKRKPFYIYRDEETNEIKEVPLSDSGGSALINKSMKKKINEARLIHDSIFGKP